MDWKESFSIGGRRLGEDEPCYVVAEIGSNHEGLFSRAVDLMKLAADAGADAVKFQLFSAEKLVARRVADDEGNLQANPYFSALEKLSVPLEWLPDLLDCSEDLGVEFIAAPYDEERLEALVELGSRAIRIASGDLAYTPLLEKAAATHLPILLSTGMSPEEEIDEAMKTILGAGGRRVALLHCVPRFPPDDAEMNLLAMKTMKKRFGTPVGLSDHTTGFTAALGAAAIGASVVEKYVTLDNSQEGLDHSFAMEPDDFAEMVGEIRRLETMMGDGVKRTSGNGQTDQQNLQRSLVAARPLKKGTKLKEEDVLCVRPGGGIPPEDLPEYIGKKLARKVEQDARLSPEDFD